MYVINNVSDIIQGNKLTLSDIIQGNKYKQLPRSANNSSLQLITLEP